MNTLIISHANCMDGSLSAYLLWSEYGGDVVFCHYGDTVDFSGYDRIYIGDFSFPPVVLDQMAESAEVWVWDHHASAIERLSDYNNPRVHLVLDDSLCGAALIALSQEIHWWCVDYVNDRDLWKWSLQDSREISAGFEYFGLKHDWQGWESVDRAACVEAGRVLVRSVDGAVAAFVENWKKSPTYVEVDGVRMPFANCTDLISERCGALAGSGVACTWFWRDGKFIYSFRGEEALRFAQALGGGGHPRAAGATLDHLLGDNYAF